MKFLRKGAVWLAALALCAALGGQALALEADSLVPVGETVGIRIKTGGVMVVGFAQLDTEKGKCCPAAEAGLETGDIIVGFDGKKVSSAAEFLTAAAEAKGETVMVRVMRNGQEAEFCVRPVTCGEGERQLGLWLRDGVSGIGTVTFYDPESGVYGALGHGINDMDTEKLMPTDSGEITDATVVDVVKGSEGTPGELQGVFDPEQVIGDISGNTVCGIFGKYSGEPGGKAVPVADKDEVQLGKATIMANVSGDKVEEYEIEISRIYHDTQDTRFVMLSVTDPRLLSLTGGIVQGMSGSPIIQDGKIVGAVTHVLISDPTRGYGISIQDMLKAAG